MKKHWSIHFRRRYHWYLMNGVLRGAAWNALSDAADLHPKMTWEPCEAARTTTPSHLQFAKGQGSRHHWSSEIKSLQEHSNFMVTQWQLLAILQLFSQRYVLRLDIIRQRKNAQDNIKTNLGSWASANCTIRRSTAEVPRALSRHPSAWKKSTHQRSPSLKHHSTTNHAKPLTMYQLQQLCEL